MRFLATLIVFLLCFTSTVFSATNNTQGGTPSYTKELVSLPSLDTPIQPIATAPSNVTEPKPTVTKLEKTMQSLNNKKMNLLQKLSLLRKIQATPKQTPNTNEGGNADGLAIASLATGVGGLVLAFIPYLGWIGLAACICGIIFGVSAKKKGTAKRGMATAGMICGIIGCALFVLGLVILASFLAAL